MFFKKQKLNEAKNVIQRGPLTNQAVKHKSTTRSLLAGEEPKEGKWTYKIPTLIFCGLCFIVFLIFCLIYGLRHTNQNNHQHHHKRLVTDHFPIKFSFRSFYVTIAFLSYSKSGFYGEGVENRGPLT